jgi:hypothetical protein
MFFYIFEKNKFNIMKQAFQDWKNGYWDNSFIHNDDKNVFPYSSIDGESFRKILNEKNLIVTYNKRMIEFLRRHDISYELYDRKFLFPKKNAVLLHNSYIAAVLFYKEAHYFVDINENDIIYFSLPSTPFIDKIIGIVVGFFYAVLFKIAILGKRAKYVVFGRTGCFEDIIHKKNFQSK